MYQVVQHFFLDPCTLLLVLISKSQKCTKKKIRVTSSRGDLIFQFHILKKLLVLAKRFPVISSKINTMEHYMGLQSKKKIIFLFVMISLNYKCSKDAKTGLGLVRGCLVRLLVELDIIQVASEHSCTVLGNCTL